jgi:hypothetical protein
MINPAENQSTPSNGYNLMPDTTITGQISQTSTTSNIIQYKTSKEMSIWRDMSVESFVTWRSELEHKIRNQGEGSIHWQEYIAGEIRDALFYFLKAIGIHDIDVLSPQDFIAAMDKHYVQETKTFAQHLAAWNPPGSIKCHMSLSRDLGVPLTKWYKSSLPTGRSSHGPTEELQIVDLIHETLTGARNTQLDEYLYVRLNNVKAQKPKTFGEWMVIFHQEANKELDRMHEQTQFAAARRELDGRKRKREGPIINNNNNNTIHDNKKFKNNNDNKNNKTNNKLLCEGCGFNHESPGNGCPLSTHPGFNSKFATVKWKDSSMGSEYKKSTNSDRMVLGKLPDGSAYAWRKALNRNLIEQIIFGEKKPAANKSKKGNNKRP